LKEYTSSLLLLLAILKLRRGLKANSRNFLHKEELA